MLAGLASVAKAIENELMEVSGTVQNGVVVLPKGVALPEGLEVTVVCFAPMIPSAGSPHEITLPLIHTNEPLGSLNLTNERIAEILNAEDVLVGHKYLAGDGD